MGLFFVVIRLVSHSDFLPSLLNKGLAVTVFGYQITAIDVKQEYYEYSNEVTVTLSFTGECTGRYTNTDTNCEVIWTLTDDEGYKIDSGSAYSPILSAGDKFRNVEALIFDLEPGQTYNLDIGTSIK